MSFLSPVLFAVLLPLTALPLILHLLSKGFPRHFRFPSIQLIQETLAKRARLHRWRHWILLLLRTAFLVLLLLAFLRPVIDRFGANPAAAGGRQVLIVLDHSLSMEDRGDGPSSRERAVHEATRLLESLDAKDTVNLLLMDQSLATCFVTFTGDFGEARRFLSRLPPGFGRADVNQANAAAARLIGHQFSRPEVYYLSDFQRKNWANADFSAIPIAARLYFVDVGPANRDNLAILDARPSQTQVLAGDTVMLEVTLGNFSHEAFSGRLTVSVDKQFSLDQNVSLAPWSEGKVAVPVPIGGPGVHLCELRLPPDALDYDNHFFLTIAAQEKEEVLVVTDAPDDHKGGAFFIATALNPFEHEGGSLLPRVIPSTAISPSRLAGVQKMFFTRIGRLSPESGRAIAQFLFQGGGLVYFLDGEWERENLETLEKAVGPGTMPLRLSRYEAATNLASGAQQIVRGDFKSPYLKLFAGDARQDLALLEFYDYYRAGVTGAGRILLVYGDESPAMASLQYGLGTALLLNFSADERSGNLARQRIFPAWMQDLAKCLATQEPPPSSHQIGETVQTEIWRNESHQDLMGPSGTPVMTHRELAGERCRLTFTPAQPGFYALGNPRPTVAFGVNPSPDEADLRPIDKEVLPTEFAASRPAHFVAGGDDYAELARGKAIFHWFILAGLVFLVLESGFQFLIRKGTT